LVLQVGMNMPVPIPDLRLDDEGMSCTLSFNRAPFFCVVPWSAVFAMVGEDGRGMVWPDDVPAEVARQAQSRGAEATRKELPKPGVPAMRDASSKAEGATKPKRPRQRPSLAAVPDEETAAPQPKATATTARAAQSPVRPVTPLSPAPSPRTALPTSRKRRELPPYLRVVK